MSNLTAVKNIIYLPSLEFKITRILKVRILYSIYSGQWLIREQAKQKASVSLSFTKNG